MSTSRGSVIRACVAAGWAAVWAVGACGADRSGGGGTSAEGKQTGAPQEGAMGGARAGAGPQATGSDPASDGTGGATQGKSPPPTRLIAPLSGSIDDSLRPQLSWAGGAGTVDICRDRACADVVTSLDGVGQARPDAPLPSGTLFWRVTTPSNGPTATWQITIPHRESGRPIAFASVPDYNGDGLADVAFGAVGGDAAGRVVIFYGSRTAISATDPDVTLTGSLPSFGCGVAAIGDTNGDGFTDLAVATDCDSGPVIIYHGSAAGPVKGPTVGPGPVAGAFGQTMASAGDVNGDGYGDLIVGGQQVAQVYVGGPEGVSPQALTGLLAAAHGAAGVVQGPGDLNGDGLPDVTVAPGINGAMIFLGNGRKFTGQDVTLQGGGGVSFAGDFNGDGFDDFDTFGVFPGTPSGIDAATPLYLQPTQPVYTAAGDIDGDGFFDEVRLVGGEIRPEHYDLVFGQPQASIFVRFVPIFVPGVTAQDFAILAGVGDVDGDGADDLVAARPSVGTVFLYRGGSGFPGSPARTWTGPPGFGASVPALYGTATFFGNP